MNVVKIGNAFYNLDQLVKYVEHVGQREVGTVEEGLMNPRPSFDEFRFFELFFVGGSRVSLDEVQSEAFRRVIAEGSIIDLCGEEEESWGAVLVKDSESGDVIVSPETLERGEITEDVLAKDAESAEAHVPPVVVDEADQVLPGLVPRHHRGLGSTGLFGQGPESITQDGI